MHWLDFIKCFRKADDLVSCFGDVLLHGLFGFESVELDGLWVTLVAQRGIGHRLIRTRIN